ncbi:hypothetical protein, unlikely [Trypanosoma brucei gambiense DAL972]|uniref:Uncharacterized protein n=1 Tax=Trypanosoma brucei gambiense (strain MHOM/CI/86/DAL972) TaxID=679716 RepID=C9ZQ02_TRYB9|nr:hypothetical protein, unlikely [Trypanosoma brucei gambiense DAL972]CBH11480.1 hypothetical protein, unlikely [Trypanosoma brucei gambiense DAL972]|eukprot:XP_011773767.1 hypothetical protein, unlikely [Trypanosoma brucei gambiense DAL972]
MKFTSLFSKNTRNSPFSNFNIPPACDVKFLSDEPFPIENGVCSLLYTKAFVYVKAFVHSTSRMVCGVAVGISVKLTFFFSKKRKSSLLYTDFIYERKKHNKSFSKV